MTRYEQLIALVDAANPSECSLWNGPKVGPYGSLKAFGRQRRAHRVAYEVALGSIPPGLHVCHRCDVPMCVNPFHLFLGTAADNMADMVAKGRSDKGRPHPKGGDSPCSRLTEETVRAILLSPLGRRRAAKAFGTPPSWVAKIRARKAWANLEIDPSLIPARGNWKAPAT